MKTPTNIPSTLCFRASPFIACLWKLTQQQVWKSVSVSPSHQNLTHRYLCCAESGFLPFSLFLLPKDFCSFICCLIWWTIVLLHIFTVHISPFDIYIYLMHYHLPSRFDHLIFTFICFLVIYHPDFTIWYLHLFAFQLFTIQIWSISFCCNLLRAFNHSNQKLYTRHSM